MNPHLIPNNSNKKSGVSQIPTPQTVYGSVTSNEGVGSSKQKQAQI